MTEAVVDASVILKWFKSEGERHLPAARLLRNAFEAGELLVVAPPLLRLEIVNVAGRRWHLGEVALVELADALGATGFEFKEPRLDHVARWIARGLTAYDASYVALAAAEGLKLITDDDLIITVAPQIATALAAA